MKNLDLGKCLDTTYGLFAYTGASCIVIMAALTITSIMARFFNVYIPGLAHLAGYFMAVGNCLALAYTFRKGAHIRIEILVSKLSSNKQLTLDKIAIIISLFVASYLAYYMFKISYYAWDFQEISAGARYVKVWAPQFFSALGILLLAISLAHTLVDKNVYAKPNLTS